MLKKWYATEAEVPADIKQFYKAGADGKWHLQLDQDDAAELRRALEHERDEVKKLKLTAEKFKDIDPEKARKALDELAALEEDKAKKAGEFEALKTQLTDRHKGEIAAKDTEISKRDKLVEKLVVDNAAISALTTAKGRVKVLLPHVKSSVKVIIEDGEARAVVVDAKGQTRIGDNNGTPMTIDQLVAEMKTDPDYAPNFESDVRGGGGAPNQRTNANTNRGGGAGTVSKSDQKGLNKNLADIATGKMTVVDDRAAG